MGWLDVLLMGGEKGGLDDRGQWGWGTVADLMRVLACATWLVSATSGCECLCCFGGDLGGDGNFIGSRSGLGSIRKGGVLVSTGERWIMVMPSWPSGSEGSDLVGAGPGLGGLGSEVLL